jgi:hypothetical protein
MRQHLPYAPVRNELTSGDSRVIAEVWQYWLQQLYQRVGGSTSMSVSDLEVIVGGLSADISRSAASTQRLLDSAYAAADTSTVTSQIKRLFAEVESLSRSVNRLMPAVKPDTTILAYNQPRTALDTTALHKAGAETVRGVKSFSVPVYFTDTTASSADRLWAVTSNEGDAGYLGFWPSVDATTNPDITTVPPFQIGENDIKLDTGVNIKVAETKIGTATTQKISLWNAAPIVRPTALTTGLEDVAVTSTDTSPWGYSSQSEADSIGTLLNNLNKRMDELETRLENFGFLPAP